MSSREPAKHGAETSPDRTSDRSGLRILIEKTINELCGSNFVKKVLHHIFSEAAVAASPPHRTPPRQPVWRSQESPRSGIPLRDACQHRRSVRPEQRQAGFTQKRRDVARSGVGVVADDEAGDPQNAGLHELVQKAARPQQRMAGNGYRLSCFVGAGRLYHIVAALHQRTGLMVVIRSVFVRLARCAIGNQRDMGRASSLAPYQGDHVFLHPRYVAGQGCIRSGRRRAAIARPPFQRGGLALAGPIGAPANVAEEQLVEELGRVRVLLVADLGVARQPDPSVVLPQRAEGITEYAVDVQPAAC